ncbi:ankyrin repeat-containing domain, PGG domain protein [Artemisia annua]|uniref:Ankyrin repeat-containing domain, PGG domain protein n=1 Tax=Artemisia annua TaxID=35608 RepID=A0A2U1MQJ8_ARTAN|nr:ankyrin repeat-containing domain, PGG domain protein [Artemisia annua]
MLYLSERIFATNYMLWDNFEGAKKDYLEIGVPLYEASIKCDWGAAEKILLAKPELVRYSITENGETALHIAASAKGPKHVAQFVKNLVGKMTNADLELANKNPNTALYLAAAAGNLETVKIMVDNNVVLPQIPGVGQTLPLYAAALFGNYEVVKYLYKCSKGLSDDGWNPQNRGLLFEKCIESDMFVLSNVACREQHWIQRFNDVYILKAVPTDCRDCSICLVEFRVGKEVECLKVYLMEKNVTCLILLMFKRINGVGDVFGAWIWKWSQWVILLCDEFDNYDKNDTPGKMKPLALIDIEKWLFLKEYEEMYVVQNYVSDDAIEEDEAMSVRGNQVVKLQQQKPNHKGQTRMIFNYYFISSMKVLKTMHKAVVIDFYYEMKILNNAQPFNDLKKAKQFSKIITSRPSGHGLMDVALDIVKNHPELGRGSALGVLAKKPEALSEKKSNVIGRTFRSVPAFICPKAVAAENESEALQLLRIIWGDIVAQPKNVIDKILRGPPDPIKSGSLIQTTQLRKLILEILGKLKKETNDTIQGPEQVSQLKKLVYEPYSSKTTRWVLKKEIKLWNCKSAFLNML